MQALAYQDTSSAGSKVAAEQFTVDPRRRRFGYNPGIWQMEMAPRSAGQSQELLPFGLITFRTDHLTDENYDDVLRVPEGEFQKQIKKEFSAQWFLNNTLIRYQSQGFRELTSIVTLDDPQPNEKGNITKEQVAKSAQGHYAAVHPSFSEIDFTCPEGLSECATCRLGLLGTPENCPDDLRERMSKLANPTAANQLRVELIEANAAYRQFCEARWAELLGEIQNRKAGEPGVNKIDPSGHHVRKNLHAIEPSDAATAASFGQEVADGQKEGFQTLAEAFKSAKGADNSDLLRMMIERQDKQDEILAKLAEKITK